jgi:hypothetical protein
MGGVFRVKVLREFEMGRLGPPVAQRCLTRWPQRHLADWLTGPPGTRSSRGLPEPGLVAFWRVGATDQGHKCALSTRVQPGHIWAGYWATGDAVPGACVRFKRLFQL